MLAESASLAAKRFELKYVFDGNTSSTIIDWADHCLVADPRYPQSTISSIYFDSHSMSSYHEKRNSEFLKSKMRLRWYDSGAVESGVTRRECFLELKCKTGPQSSKSRVAVSVANDLLVNPFVNEVSLRRLLAAAAADLNGNSLLASPVILIEYDRRRYVDPGSGCRVAVDASIRACGNSSAPWVNTERGSLNVGVIEIKGDQRVLPRSLQTISSHLFRESFSKYGRCCEMLAQPLVRRI